MSCHNDDPSNAIVLLPIDLRRYIIRFIQRSKSAEIIHKSFSKIRLNYVRNFRFTYNSIKKYNVWKELSPSSLQTLFYGDKKHIIRTNISKGEYMRLRKLGILSSGIRIW